ncbi:MAG TPA: hypothetical protein DCL60_05670 [Armatimonadetes bacterium]|nr:hypothetical protein [Armatimonadota bacterium]
MSQCAASIACHLNLLDKAAVPYAARQSIKNAQISPRRTAVPYLKEICHKKKSLLTLSKSKTPGFAIPKTHAPPNSRHKHNSLGRYGTAGMAISACPVNQIALRLASLFKFNRKKVLKTASISTVSG